jgi:hypothetical protein
VVPANPERKQLLIDALRSGEYKQARRQLRNGDSFCCLGVACDLYLKHAGDVHAKWADDEAFISSIGISSGSLPTAVCRWYGFADYNPNIPRQLVGKYDDGSDKYAISLAEANDEGMTFAQIADIIEKEL